MNGFIIFLMLSTIAQSGYAGLNSRYAGMLNNLPTPILTITLIPGPDREKHSNHFKISTMRISKFWIKLKTMSHQGGPVNPVKILFVFTILDKMTILFHK